MPSATDPGQDPLVGRTLDGRYRVDELIGRGGMGEVYRGTHILMNRRVALKVLRPERAEDENAIRRFVREAKSTFRFDHPNCVRVTDFGIAQDGNNLLYLVMEYLDGRTVGEELHYDGPLSSSRVIHVASQVCAALQHAHSLALIHRDIKPDNIMLIKRGDDPDFVKVLDFGLAKLFEGPQGFRTTIMSMSPLTQDGIVFGTPEYMSPEQALGQPLDQRTDVYSLGVIMYEMLTGLTPFQGASFMALLSKHVKERPIAPDERRPELGIRPELSRLVMRCIEKKRKDRPQSAEMLADEVEALQRGFSVITGRVPKTVAESDTMDLSDDANTVADTLERRLRERQRQRVPPQQRPHVSTPVAELRELYRGRRIVIRIILAVLGAGIAMTILIVLLKTGAKDDSQSHTSTPPPIDARGNDDHPRDASVVDATSKTAVAAADSGARPGRRHKQPPARTRSPAHGKKWLLELRGHLRAARKAQKDRNTLKQMAESDAALRLDPRNPKAFFLKGDALLRSGDKSNGCKYLRRAWVRREARRRYIDGKCS